MSNTLNPLDAVVTAKRADLAREQGKLTALTTLRTHMVQWDAAYDAAGNGPNNAAQRQAVIQEAHEAAVAAGFGNPLTGFYPGSFISVSLDPAIRNQQQLVDSLTRELRDLEIQRDQLDAAAAARIGEGASAEAAYGIERGKLQLKTTLLTVGKWVLIAGAVALVLWGAVKLYKRINRNAA